MNSVSMIDQINRFYRNAGAAIAGTREGRDPTMNVHPRRFSGKEIEGMVRQLNENALQRGEKLSFSYNEKADRVVVRIMDRNLEIIQQIPSEEMLRLIEHLKESAGIFIDESR